MRATYAVDILANHQSDELTWVKDDDQAAIALLHEKAAASAIEVIRTAQGRDAEAGLRRASELKVLCATRFGPLGVSGWSARIEALTARALPDAASAGAPYMGRPVVVTRNDYFNHLFNGDVGLVVARARPVLVAAFQDPSGGVRQLAMSQLGDIDTWWAATIHKSQGSEFERVIVSLPPAPSPILTRELLYTAVTRAQAGHAGGRRGVPARRIARPVAELQVLRQTLAVSLRLRKTPLRRFVGS